MSQIIHILQIIDKSGHCPDLIQGQPYRCLLDRPVEHHTGPHAGPDPAAGQCLRSSDDQSIQLSIAVSAPQVIHDQSGFVPVPLS